MSTWPLRGRSEVLRKMMSWHNRKNWCRNLQRLIYKFAMTLRVQVSMAELLVQFRGKSIVTPWPMLKFSSWVQTVFSRTSGEPLLGGLRLSDEAAWRGKLQQFWDRYRAGFGWHAVFNDFPQSLDACIPVLLHGDEGRGKHKRAVMVTSVQPLLHDGGHSFLTRFLCAVLPAEQYCGDVTLDEMQTILVQDLQDLYLRGFQASGLPYDVCPQPSLVTCAQVETPDGMRTLRFVLCGVKGDWPYLRAWDPRIHACKTYRRATEASVTTSQQGLCQSANATTAVVLPHGGLWWHLVP